MNESTQNKKNVRWGDFFSAVLLIIILQIAAARLVATQWTKDLDTVEYVTFLGVILGLMLGKSIFRRFWVAVFSIAYGIIIIPWQLGSILDLKIGWNDRLSILWNRLVLVMEELFTRKPVTDNLLFISLMALLFWSLAIYSAFVLMRQDNPWKVVIPGGIATFVIHSFDPLLARRSWYLAFYLFFALLLVARLVYLKNTARWRGSRTHTPPDIGFDLTRVALVLSMVLIFFAWNVPVLANTFGPAARIWNSASRPWLSTKDKFSFMFASLRASVGLVQNYYGNTLQMGLGAPLSNAVVMEVQAPTNPPSGNRFYWEARSYDIYQDNQWLSDLTSVNSFSPNGSDLASPGVDVRTVVTSTILTHVPISNLYIAPEPLWVSLPARANSVLNPDGSVDIAALTTGGIVHPGETYQARSAIETATALTLENAGTIYPQWVLDSYLQMPVNITPRTRELAKTIAAGMTNPYDIANIVTQYLRKNITYDQTISRPPENQDRIDWFLFEYKKGFCTYYASAEVILLRSLGIPARLAVGYAEGQQETQVFTNIPSGAGSVDSNNRLNPISTYVVRQKDAHAWPEVFFPDVGWVIFEPTASQAAINRPSGMISSPAVMNRNLPEEDSGENKLDLLNSLRSAASYKESTPANNAINFWTVENIIKLFIILLAAGIVFVIIWQVRHGFRLAPFLDRLTMQGSVALEKGLRKAGIRPPEPLVKWIFFRKLPPISRSYLEINRALDRVGRKPAIHDTPFERTALLVQAIPAASTPATQLLSEYQSSIYSNQEGDQENARKASSEIRKLSWSTWLKQLLARFNEQRQ